MLQGFGFGSNPTNSVAGGQSTFVSNIKGVSKTGAYSVLSTDSWTLFDNDLAVGEVDFSLPAAVAKPASGAEYIFGFLVLAAQTVKIIANGTDMIRNGAIVSSAGGNVSVATIGSIIWIVNPKVGVWVTFASPIGAWSFA